MSEVKPIILVTPQANTPALKASLEGAGYAVIVTSRPDEIRVLDVMPLGTLDAVARAAYETLRGHAYSSTQAQFGEAVARNMLAARGALDESEAGT